MLSLAGWSHTSSAWLELGTMVPPPDSGCLGQGTREIIRASAGNIRNSREVTGKFLRFSALEGGYGWPLVCVDFEA